MKNLLALLFCLAILFSACSKDGETKKSTSAIVKYEVTWAGTPLPGYPNGVTYSNATGNGQNDTNLSGSSWTKTVTVNTDDVKQLMLIATISTAKAGMCTAKIYVDGKVRSENQAPSSVSSTWFTHHTIVQFNF